jgi:hypothetical protein
MADTITLQRFSQLYSQGFLPSVGSWVQVAPGLGLTTLLNAFNTLGNQDVEMFLFDVDGATVYTGTHYIPTNNTLRLDLENVVPPDALPFEGSLWMWCKGDDDEGALGLQAVDLDFVDHNMPAGHVMGSVHLIFDFINTLGIAPYMDLVTPRILVGETPEGSPTHQNFLGLAHVIVGLSDATGCELAITVSNEDGATIEANQTIVLPALGSWFGDLQVLFPTLPSFLMRPGEKRGYGVVNIREKNDKVAGLAGMIKVVDVVSGAMLVGHVNDRHFARPAMKD